MFEISSFKVNIVDQREKDSIITGATTATLFATNFSTVLSHDNCNITAMRAGNTE